MRSPWSDSTRWNIFARELEQVLAARGSQLGKLDDSGVVEHPEKVRRLQHSLTTPKHFPVLNPEEIARLVTTMNLTDDEQNRLRAALLATAVERVLMDRLMPDVALMAANDVYEICLAVMRDDPERLLTSVRDGRLRGNITKEDELLGEALDLIDNATLALHGAHIAVNEQTKMDYAVTAAETFARAMTTLRAVGIPPEFKQAWQAYMDEASEGETFAQSLLGGKGQ